MLWSKLIFLEHNTEQGGNVCTQICTKKMCIPALCNDLRLPFFQTKLGRLDEELIPGAVTLDNLNKKFYAKWGRYQAGIVLKLYRWAQTAESRVWPMG